MDLRLSKLWMPAAAILLSACASGPKVTAPLPTVAKVEVPRYMGKWHEVARLPMVFQKGCVESTAQYALQADQTVSVVNRCLKDGKPKSVRGTATVVDKATNAVLEVRFNEWYSVFIPRAREGNYFIIWLAPDYSAAAVGTPDRKYLWLLSRQATMAPSSYRAIVKHASSLGFPIQDLLVEPGQQSLMRR